jgi:hypothetical protein
MFVEIEGKMVNLSNFDYWEPVNPPKGDTDNVSNTHTRIAFYKDDQSRLNICMDNPQATFDLVARYIYQIQEK